MNMHVPNADCAIIARMHQSMPAQLQAAEMALLICVVSAQEPSILFCWLLCCAVHPDAAVAMHAMCKVCFVAVAVECISGNFRYIVACVNHGVQQGTNMYSCLDLG